MSDFSERVGSSKSSKCEMEKSVWMAEEWIGGSGASMTDVGEESDELLEQQLDEDETRSIRRRISS